MGPEQQLLAGGISDDEDRLMVAALYVVVRVASLELVLAILKQAHQRKDVTLSLLKQRFRLPPRRSARPDPVNPEHLLASYDHLLIGSSVSGSGTGCAAAAQTAETRLLSQSLVAAMAAS